MRACRFLRREGHAPLTGGIATEDMSQGRVQGALDLLLECFDDEDDDDLACGRGASRLPGPSRMAVHGMSLDSLAAAVAPAVYGHRHAKKSILLMLLGGNAVSDRGAEGCKRSGHIHVCLFGGHATAKSMLLRWVASFWPQAVYVSGASASAAGLTAAVLDDAGSAGAAADGNGGRVVAPGALMQASPGVCCIDDFERLDLRGQESIREVLDQQSITLCKGGMRVTLRTSASVLLACAPAPAPHSRRKRTDGCATTAPAMLSTSSCSPDNPPLPRSVAHCLDVVSILRDGPSAEHDDDDVLVRHILSCITEPAQPRSSGPSQPELLRHITAARSIKPSLTCEAEESLRACYARRRRPRNSSAAAKGSPSANVTPRYLESLIRLSEAVARGYLSSEVHAGHVDEAFALTCCEGDEIVAAKRPRIECK